MLSSLHISNFILLKDISIDLCDSLNVFTGETGAGKSMLMDSIRFVLGKKVDRLSANIKVEKSNNEIICVSALFKKPSESIKEILNEHGISIQGDEIILRRTVSKQKSKAFIQDIPVSLSFLKSIGNKLMDIHGQDDGVLNANNHIYLLDSFCNVDLLKNTSESFYNWRELKKEYEKEMKEFQSLIENKPFLEKTLNSLESLNLYENEEEELLENRKKLFNDQKTQRIIEKSIEPLKVNSVISSLQSCEESLLSLSKIKDESIKHLDSIRKAIAEVQDVSYSLEIMSSQTSNVSEELLELDERLHTLRSWSKRVGCFSNEIFSFYKNLSEKLSGMNEREIKLNELGKSVKDKFNLFLKFSEELNDERLNVAENLSENITKELKGLHLKKAICKIKVCKTNEEKWGKHGINEVSFLASMNGEDEFKEINVCASGGEKSRITLAIRSLMSNKLNIPILIFDEIDTGVGGAVATAMGKRMSNLSKHMQVLSITHSPQVAVYAKNHFLLKKTSKDNVTYSEIKNLDLSKRKDEISRMLSGDKVTPEAEGAALRLLNEYSPDFS